MQISLTNLSLTSTAHSSVPQHYPSTFCNLGHTIQCNGLDSLLKSNMWWISDKSSLTWCKYMSSSQSRPCCKWTKAWVAWLLKGMKNIAWKVCFWVSSMYKFGDLSLKLLAENSGDPTIFENAIHKMTWPESCATFLTNAIHALSFFIAIKGFYRRYYCLDEGWSTITDIRRLVSLTVYLACATRVASGWFKVM